MASVAPTQRPLGRHGPPVSCLGYGAVKIGRNQSVKYPRGFELPDDAAVRGLIDAVLDLGINYIDTAPAYGSSEARLGPVLRPHRDRVVLASKVGERFEPDAGAEPGAAATSGRSVYDFTRQGMLASVDASLTALQTDHLDVLYLHSDGRDLAIQTETDAVATLIDLKSRGKGRLIGISGKTVEGFEHALGWADVLMVEYNTQHPGMSEVMQRAHDAGLGIVIKKGLGSGWLDPEEAIRFVLDHPAVDCLVVGGLNPAHLRDNVASANRARPAAPAPGG